MGRPSGGGLEGDGAMGGVLIAARRGGAGQAKALVALAAAAAAYVALPATARADFTASLSVGQSAGTMAGSSQAIGFDEKFGSASGDAAKTVSLTLPPGLLTNESIAGGRCLLSSTPDAACQVGSGTVSLAGGGSPSFAVDLVKPPNSADFAGFSFVFGTTPLITSDVTLGANGAATLVSNLAPGIAETNFTVTDRLPTSCPSPPATVTMTAVSQSGESVTATAPLKVMGCSGLPYAPTLAVSEAADAREPGATLGFDITQAANEAASKTIVLKLPSGLGVSPAADARCLRGAGCVVGSARATSPLAPTDLTGTVTLHGPATSPTVTVAFPAPFALTLVANVSLSAGTVTIDNVPDIPLTDLSLTITRPTAHKVFTTMCTPSTATATFTSQSGVTRTVSTNVALTHCAARPSATGRASGLAAGQPKLHIRVSHGESAAKIASVAIALPAGLKFAPSATKVTRTCLAKQAKKPCTTTPSIKGLAICGARLQSIALKRGKLMVTPQQAAASITVNVSPPVLMETDALQRRVTKHNINTVSVTVTVTDAKHTTTSVALKLKAQ